MRRSNFLSLERNYLNLLILILVVGVLSPAIGQDKPLKVFLLVGQSNMQGHAHVRTLPHIGMDDETKPLLAEIQDESGKARVHKDVYISYLSSKGVKSGNLTTGFGADENKIGPELTFGIYMQKKLKEPILIIKTAWGGKSINTDFRPPSAGAYEFNESQIENFKKRKVDVEQETQKRAKATGVYYRLTIEHIKKVLADIKSVYPDYNSKSGYEIAGMVWFQGWNDMVDRGTYPNRDKDGGYGAYSEVLNHFIRDVRKDLSVPKMPFVIGVMGTGGPTSKYRKDQMRYQKIHQNFRDAMAAPASQDEFKGNVIAVKTEECWDMELDELLYRNGKINQELKKQQKDGKLTKAEFKSAFEKARAEKFSERELKIMEIGRSNAAFHYLGSGKVMARIGKAFAEALQ